FELVTKLARHLRELGVERGDHVAVLGENRPEWGVSLFALSWIGAVAVPLDARAPVESHKFIMSFSSCRALIASRAFTPGIEAVRRELPGLLHIIPMESIEGLSAKYAHGAAMGNVTPGDLLQILFTSGTMGDPKGVMLTHGNVMSN